MFAFASCVSAIQSRGFGRADFTPIPGSIQQTGGGAGLSLVVSTHVFLGAVQKENIFQRLLAPRPPVLLILQMFQKKMNFSISKKQSFRINIKNAGFNVIKSLKLSQNRGFGGLGLVWWGFFVTPVQESKEVLCQERWRRWDLHPALPGAAGGASAARRLPRVADCGTTTVSSAASGLFPAAGSAGPRRSTGTGASCKESRA